MADPISVTASIVAVMQATMALVDFLRSLRGTSKEVKSMLKDLLALQKVLGEAMELSHRPRGQLPGPTVLSTSGTPLKECLTELEKLRKKLIPVNNLDKTLKAVVWRFQQAEINNILTKIER